MTKQTLVWGLVSALWLVGGCGSSGSGGDGGASYSDNWHYVIKQIMVPENAGHAQALARDIDGDGDKENVLGQFFAFIQAMAIPHGCEQTVNSTISQGKTLVLLQVMANLGSSSTQDGGQSPVDEALVRMTMGRDLNGDATDNFDGKGEFAVDEKYKAELSGTITGRTELAAGRAKTFLPLAPGGEVKTVSLHRAMLEGKISTASLDQGVLSGGVPMEQFKLLLMPGLASVLDCVVNNPIGGGG